MSMFNTGALSTIPFVLFLGYRFHPRACSIVSEKQVPPLFERNEELR